MNFAIIIRINRHIDTLRSNLKGLNPPWYQRSCQATIDRLEAELQLYCLDC